MTPDELREAGKIMLSHAHESRDTHERDVLRRLAHGFFDLALHHERQRASNVVQFSAYRTRARCSGS